MHRVARGAFLAFALAGAVLTGCGGGGNSEETAQGGAPVEGKQGGTLKMLWTDDVDNIDPGITYYQMGYMVSYATQRPLYSWKPDDGETPVPDLAESDPQVSEDGKTVTVKIRDGVRFSPPVNREVTSQDVKYAIERGFFNTVNNGYAGGYFGDLVGAAPGAKPGTEIEGIRTPDDQTIVFKLSRGSGGVLAGALALPLSAPVPEDYAAKFDKQNPSMYGQNQVATGPYMIENDATGKAIGYEAGRRIHLVRNPNWDEATDYKPAYVDEIDMPQGNDDTTVASRKVLEGESLLSGDFSPPPAVLAQVVKGQKDQLELMPAGSARYISMNTTIKPFDDINVRKAVIAGFDREALRLVRGGEQLGDIPTHMIPPGMPGFDESGGEEGFGLDFMANPAGDTELAAEYFRKAGYASGRYEGDEELLMVGVSEGVAQNTAEVAKENFERLGFKVRLRLVTQDAMFTKFCALPSAKVAICPNFSWGKDFSDPQTMLAPTFDGDNIIPQMNSNWSQLDVPAINEAMDEAAVLSDPAERAQAWARINRMITEQAPLISWIWDKTPLLRSANVNGAASEFNSAWDLAWTSLK
ncbi:MAG TPA: ABC transporter substrate-binding protein [Solirubrobacteraceae bacterium]|nr:ABC transporter substrate-binding protein [Solirubrobacteraceae bacterium]